MNALREQAREQLRIYMCRSQASLRDIAVQMGFAHRSLIQFVSCSRYGVGDGEFTAQTVLDWLKANPLPSPEIPGTLYETDATRQVDDLLNHCKHGGWGTLYGPSGSQKTFTLEYRGAEAAREAQPPVVYVRCSASGMTPTVLLRRVAATLGSGYGQGVESLRQTVLFAMRRRRSSFALVLDEADSLYRWVETLETLREIGDLCRARPGKAGIGILIAGNERVMQIFSDRQGVYLEKWRARIQQRELRVIGPSPEEARGILVSELGELREKTLAAIVDECTVEDPVTRKRYVNAHRLFNAIREAQRKRTN